MGRTTPAIAALCFASVLAGCDTPETAKGTDSLLALWTPPSPEVAAQMALDEYNADNRAKGMMLLANAYFGGEPVYRELYLARITDEDPNVRAAALRGLSLHGQPEDVPVVIERLSDSNPRVRVEAARALQRIHNPAAIDALIVAIRLPIAGPSPTAGEPEPTVRAEAANALGQYADPRVLLPLMAALDDRFLAVNRAAQRSLNTLTGEDFGLDRREWLRWYQDVETPFAGRTPYIYPAFSRDKSFWEYIPFIPEPPNESAGTPAGFPPLAGRASPTPPDSGG